MIMTVIVRRTSSCTMRAASSPGYSAWIAARIGAASGCSSRSARSKQAGPQAILHVVAVIGDVVGDRGGLRLEAGEAMRAPDPAAPGRRGWRTAAAAGMRPIAVPRHRASGPLCLTSPSSVSQREVQPVEGRIATLQLSDHAQALGVVVEPLVCGERLVERPLAGMAEGRVAEIMGERQRLRQVLVETERAGDGAGDLRHLQRMDQAGAEMIALVLHEDLRLVLQPAKGVGMDDAVAVALERRAQRSSGSAWRRPRDRGRVAGIGGAPALAASQELRAAAPPSRSAATRD